MIFTKRDWSKWEHITFAEEFTPGITVYELLRREDVRTGDVEWKKVKVQSCVHNLSSNLRHLIKDRNK